MDANKVQDIHIKIMGKSTVFVQFTHTTVVLQKFFKFKKIFNHMI